MVAVVVVADGGGGQWTEAVVAVAATATAAAVTAVVGGRSRGFVGGGRDPHRHSVLDGVCVTSHNLAKRQSERNKLLTHAKIMR